MGLVQDATGNDLTYRIIGAAMKVHNDLGPGYKEEIYERALASQLNKNGIGAKTQVPIEVWHSDSLVGLFYLDIFVEEQVEEIKAFRHQLTNDEFFISESTARQGVTITNPSETDPIVILKHFGPENPELVKE